MSTTSRYSSRTATMVSSGVLPTVGIDVTWPAHLCSCLARRTARSGPLPAGSSAPPVARNSFWNGMRSCTLKPAVQGRCGFQVSPRKLVSRWMWPSIKPGRRAHGRDRPVAQRRLGARPRWPRSGRRDRDARCCRPTVSRFRTCVDLHDGSSHVGSRKRRPRGAPRGRSERCPVSPRLAACPARPRPAS